MSKKIGLLTLISVLPVVLAGLVIIVGFGLRSTRTVYEQQTALYLSNVLEHYVAEEPRRLVELLESTGLDEVSSFVDEYQRRAVAAAEDFMDATDGGLIIYDRRNETFLCGAEALSPEEREFIVTGDRDARLRHNGPEVNYTEGGGALYVQKSFSPWGWRVAAYIPTQTLSAEASRLMVRSGVVTAVVGAALILMVGLVMHRVVIRPIDRKSTRLNSSHYS